MNRTHVFSAAKRFALIARFTVAAVMVASPASGAAPAPQIKQPLVVVTPAEDAEALLHNPDMGWVLYENYPVDPRPGGSSTLASLPEDDFAVVDEVAVMFSWADVEKKGGDYNFSRPNHAYDYWKKRGKRIQLRMSTESLLWFAGLEEPAGKGVPEWLLGRMPAERKQVRKCEGIPYVVVDARDPLYLSRLEKFLAAVAKNFSGARPVTLVDLRGFGLWGEWHSGFQYASTEDRRAALIGVIDRYADAFKDNHVSLSYSHDPDGPKELYAGSARTYEHAATGSYAEFLRFSAFDHALKRKNVTFRRDGAGGAVYSNQRRLNDEAFRTLAVGPMMSEFLGGYHANKKAGDEWLRWMVDDALSLHPNYVNVLGWQAHDARDFLRERPDLVAHGLRNMGYRLVPVRVTYPEAAAAGVPFRIEMEWVNRGVGRAMRDFTLKLDLADGKGNTVASCDAGAMGTSKWVKGESYAVAKDVTFRDVAPGECVMRMSVVDPAGGKAIALPLRDRREDGSCKVGTVVFR